MKSTIYIIILWLGGILSHNIYSQCPDLTLSVNGGNICEGDYGIATIQNAESGVYYQAYIGGTVVSAVEMGTGSNLDILIPEIQLSTGANTVNFKAFSSLSNPDNVAIFGT